MASTAPCQHDWTLIADVHRGVIDDADPIAHTFVRLMGCTRCRTVDAFPASNAALLTARYCATLRAQLADGGWQLPADIAWYDGPGTNGPALPDDLHEQLTRRPERTALMGSTILASLVIADDGPVSGVDMRHIWSLNLVVHGQLLPLAWTTLPSGPDDSAVAAEHFAQQLRKALGAPQA